MSDLFDIIDYNNHPIENTDYINFCKNQIIDKSILILNDFLTQNCLNELIFEALNLEKHAFYCSQNHTILLDKFNSSRDINDPLNIEVKSDKGCIPHDLLGKNSKLNIIYNSSIFKNFDTS